MSVAEIEAAIEQLEPAEVDSLANWIAELQARKWDEQIAPDSRSGRLDALLGEADERFDSGTCTPL